MMWLSAAGETLRSCWLEERHLQLQPALELPLTLFSLAAGAAFTGALRPFTEPGLHSNVPKQRGDPPPRTTNPHPPTNLPH